MDHQPRIETCGHLEFMGVAVYGNPAETDFHKAWELFGEVADDASISRIGKDIYGLQIYHPRFPQRFELIYMPCLVREPGMPVPIRMVSKWMPECSYAVQRCAGGVESIDEALAYLYQDFIPNRGLQVAMPIDFEKYCKVLDHETHPNEIEVWVPVK